MLLFSAPHVGSPMDSHILVLGHKKNLNRVRLRKVVVGTLWFSRLQKVGFEYSSGREKGHCLLGS